MRVRTLANGDSFGQRQFFTGRAEALVARVAEFSTVLAIRRDEFLRVLEAHPQDYELWCQLRDEMSHETHAHCDAHACPGCEAPDHDIDACPYVTSRLSRAHAVYSERGALNYARNARFRRSAARRKRVLTNEQTVARRLGSALAPADALAEDDDTAASTQRDRDGVLRVDVRVLRRGHAAARVRRLALEGPARNGQPERSRQPEQLSLRESCDIDRLRDYSLYKAWNNPQVVLGLSYP